MKQEPKKGFKAGTRNLYLFGVLLHKEKGFLSDLRAIQRKIYSSDKLEHLTKIHRELENYFWIEFRDKEKVGIEVRRILSQHLENTTFNEIWDGIERILVKYDLGPEWEDTLWIYAVSRKVFPPTFNFHTFKYLPKGKRYGNTRIGLILNPRTSIRDLMEAWPEIQKLQKSFWPEFKRKNITENSFEFLLENIAILGEKYDISDKEKYAGLTFYEEYLAKQGKWEDLKKRRKKLGTGEVKIKKKRTDKEVIDLILNLKKDRKNLKQNIGKHRKRRQRL